MKSKTTPMMNWLSIRSTLVFALLLGALVAACSLDEGSENNLPVDPSVVIDPTQITLSVELLPFNVPADGVTHTTIVAQILVEGKPVPNVPVLFYSEWGRLYTACTTPQTVTAGAFSKGLSTNSEGFASTLLQSPVLPHLYKDDNESNTIGAFFLVNGQIFQTINSSIIWQVGLASLRSAPNDVDDSISVTAEFVSGRGDPVSGCSGVSWSTVPTSGVEIQNKSLCDSSGRARTTVKFKRYCDADKPSCDSILENNKCPGGTTDVCSVTLEMVATFNGAGLNECVLDTDASLAIIGLLGLSRPRGCKCI